MEEVSADSKASKVVVKGKAADPIKVRERLQKKSGKKVELISPLPKPPEEKKEEIKEPQPEEKKDEVIKTPFFPIYIITCLVVSLLGNRILIEINHDQHAYTMNG